MEKSGTLKPLEKNKDELESKHQAQNTCIRKKRTQPTKGPTQPHQPHFQGRNSVISRFNFPFVPNVTDYQARIQGNF